jgi:hypothetical protein
MLDEQVRADFERARHRAFLHDLRALIGRRRNDLIPYHEIRNRYSPEGESYRGVQSVPVNQIVGSVDRFQDFDREFLPRQNYTRNRWQNVDRAYYTETRLPPIQLYKVGDIYFVKDGNHRVSVAREKGVEFIDAEVIEGHIRVPLYASMSPQELLLQVEYAEFLRRTDLDKSRPNHDIRPTALGRYDELVRDINEHVEWWREHRGVEYLSEEAAASWYDQVYLPIVRIVRDRGILRQFPEHTETDVYLWVRTHADDILHRDGQDDTPEAWAEAYAASVREDGIIAKLGSATRRALRRMPLLQEDLPTAPGALPPPGDEK